MGPAGPTGATGATGQSGAAATTKIRTGSPVSVSANNTVITATAGCTEVGEVVMSGGFDITAGGSVLVNQNRPSQAVGDQPLNWTVKVVTTTGQTTTVVPYVICAK